MGGDCRSGSAWPRECGMMTLTSISGVTWPRGSGASTFRDGMTRLRGCGAMTFRRFWLGDERRQGDVVVFVALRSRRAQRVALFVAISAPVFHSRHSCQPLWLALVVEMPLRQRIFSDASYAGLRGGSLRSQTA